jgi:hypothetical protein
MDAAIYFPLFLVLVESRRRYGWRHAGDGSIPSHKLLIFRLLFFRLLLLRKVADLSSKCRCAVLIFG